MLKINKIKKIILSCVILLYSGEWVDVPNGVVIPSSRQHEFLPIALANMREISRFSAAVEFGLWQAMIRISNPIVQAILNQKCKDPSFGSKIRSGDVDEIIATFDLISQMDPTIIPNIVRESGSAICNKIREIVGTEEEAPFKIDSGFLALLGLIKSPSLGKEIDAQRLLEHLTLSPEILSEFNKFYRAMDKTNLNAWITELDALEKRPFCPGILIGSNTAGDAPTLCHIGDKVATEETIKFIKDLLEKQGHTCIEKEPGEWLKDQRILDQYVAFNELQNHVYELEELLELYKLITWLKHQQSTTADEAVRNSTAIWLTHFETNPGKLCQFFITRAVRARRPHSSSSAASAA